MPGLDPGIHLFEKDGLPGLRPPKDLLRLAVE
jgi:hypothetical protein